MGMKERLIELCKELKIGQNAFEKKCGWSTGTICSYNKGIRTDKLEGVIEAYPNLNLKWLIAGKGEMWENTKEPSEDFSPKKQDIPPESINQEWLIKQIKQKDTIIEKLLSVMEKENRH